MNRDYADCIRAIATALAALADAISSQDNTAPKKHKRAAATEAAATEATENAAEKVTREQLRELLGAISSNGHTDEVKALLNKYGGGKLSTVPEENYNLLYEAAKAVQDA